MRVSSPNFVAIAFLVLFVTPFSGNSQSDEEDIVLKIYRCDPFISNTGSGTCSNGVVNSGTLQSNITTLERKVGIRINPKPLALPSREIVNTTPKVRTRSETGDSPRKRPVPDGSPVTGTNIGEPAEEPRVLNGSSASNGNKNNDSGTGMGGFGSSSGETYDGRGFIAGSMPGKADSKIHAGLLYSDDASAPGTNDKPKDFAMVEPSGTAFNALKPTNPVDQNRQNHTGNDDSGSSGGSGMGGAAGLGAMGASGSPAKGAGKGKSSGQSLLGSIAERLKEGLNNFMGLGSGSGSGGAGDTGRGLASLNGKDKNGKLGAAGFGKDPRGLLKANFDKFNRGYANSLEFGDSSSFLFQSMCQHYIDYARANRIPNGKRPCPSN